MANRIKSERVDHNFSTDDLARKIGRTRKTVYNLENSLTQITEGVLHQLCDIFDCSADWLLRRTDTRTSTEK